MKFSTRRGLKMELLDHAIAVTLIPRIVPERE
jgi:hypothetical protein